METAGSNWGNGRGFVSTEKTRWNKKSSGRKQQQREVKDGNAEEVLRFHRERSRQSASVTPSPRFAYLQYVGSHLGMRRYLQRIFRKEACVITALSSVEVREETGGHRGSDIPRLFTFYSEENNNSPLCGARVWISFSAQKLKQEIKKTVFVFLYFIFP